MTASLSRWISRPWGGPPPVGRTIVWRTRRAGICAGVVPSSQFRRTGRGPWRDIGEALPAADALLPHLAARQPAELLEFVADALGGLVEIEQAAEVDGRPNQDQVRMRVVDRLFQLPNLPV